MQYIQNYINGIWVDGGHGYLDIADPGNLSLYAKQALADKNDIDNAIKAANNAIASQELYKLRPVERGRMVRKMGDYILEHKHDIATMLSYESGKPFWEAMIEAEGAARYFEYYGNATETLEGRSIPLGQGYIDFTLYEPIGVSAQIIPWNFPLEMVARGLAPALATGTACVIKTPELDPLSSHYFAKAAEYAGIPAGYVNILCGIGHDVGDYLSSHKDIQHIVFTGSVATGSRVAQHAATNVTPCVLELGGKSAAIIYNDADIDNVVDNIRWGIYFNAGQVCSAMSRLVVHASIKDDVVGKVQGLATSLSVGYGMERQEYGANMGAMISEHQRDRAEALCQQAQAEGARIVTGGRKLNNDGCFLEPTIIDNITPDMPIAQQEIFGPVLSVISFDDDDEAINIANNSDYGLVGGIFTKNIDKALHAANSIQAGQIFVNEWYAGGVETPFGGYKKSGYGREKGRDALFNYVQTKNIAIKL